MFSLFFLYLLQRAPTIPQCIQPSLTFALGFGRAWRPGGVFHLGKQEGRLHAWQPGGGIRLAACWTAGGDRETFNPDCSDFRFKYPGADDQPVFSEGIQFLTDEGLPSKAQFLQQTDTSVL